MIKKNTNGIYVTFNLIKFNVCAGDLPHILEQRSVLYYYLITDNISLGRKQHMSARLWSCSHITCSGITDISCISEQYDKLASRT